MGVEEVFESLDGSQVSLVLTSDTNFRDAADSITSFFLERGFEGIFYTADRTYKEVRDELDYKGAETDDLLFIDAVCMSRGLEVDDSFVEAITSPTAFNDIKLAFNDLLSDLGEDRFVILDSFTSYLLYGDLKDVGNFVKAISDKLRDNDTSFIIMAVENQISDEVEERLMSFCDEKVDLTDEEF